MKHAEYADALAILAHKQAPNIILTVLPRETSWKLCVLCERK